MNKELRNCFYDKDIQLKRLNGIQRYDKNNNNEVKDIKQQTTPQDKQGVGENKCAWKSFEGTFCPEAEQLIQAKKENEKLTYKLKTQAEISNSACDKIHKLMRLVHYDDKTIIEELTEQNEHLKKDVEIAIEALEDISTMFIFCKYEEIMGKKPNKDIDGFSWQEDMCKECKATYCSIRKAQQAKEKIGKER